MASRGFVLCVGGPLDAFQWFPIEHGPLARCRGEARAILVDGGLGALAAVYHEADLLVLVGAGGPPSFELRPGAMPVCAYVNACEPTLLGWSKKLV